MHPYHLLNALRRDLPNFSNQQIFGESHASFHEWFACLAQYTEKKDSFVREKDFQVGETVRVSPAVGDDFFDSFVGRIDVINGMAVVVIDEEGNTVLVQEWQLSRIEE